MDLAGGNQRLNRNAASRVILEHPVKNGVTDLVCHLVRMALRNRLGGEEASGHLNILLCDGESARQYAPGCSWAPPNCTGASQRTQRDTAWKARGPVQAALTEPAQRAG